MSKVIKVNYKDLEIKEFMTGIKLSEIADNFKKYYNYPILAAKVDSNIVELNEPLTRSSKIDFMDRSDPTGNAIYGRTLQFLLVVATKKLLGEDVDVVIDFSIDKGFYVDVVNADIDKSTVRKIYDKMMEIVKEDYIINKVSVSRYDAIKYFKKKKQIDKVKALKYIILSHFLMNILEYLYYYNL